MFNDDSQSFSLSPINFFQIKTHCKFLPPSTFPVLSSRNHAKYLLPDTSSLCNEDHFAEVAIGWNQDGLEFFIEVNSPFLKSSYPDVRQGDSCELFIDTRDVKTSGFNTRFCHHFFFLPEPCEEISKGEITRFRTEEMHELCDPNELQLLPVLKRNQYNMHIFIPSQCLHGYDPEQFDRLGFTYRINRFKGDSQHFSVLSEEYQLEQQPSLWSSLQMIK